MNQRQEWTSRDRSEHGQQIIQAVAEFTHRWSRRKFLKISSSGLLGYSSGQGQHCLAQELRSANRPEALLASGPWAKG